MKDINIFLRMKKKRNQQTLQKFSEYENQELIGYGKKYYENVKKCFIMY